MTMRWMTRSRRTSVLALIAMLALVGAACAPDEEDTDAAADSGRSDDTSGAPDADDVELDEDATFRYAYTISPGRFDPHLSATSFDLTTLAVTYDRLVHRSVEAEPEPGLAEDWEFVDDGAALLLHIREGVTFHDGEPLDADAVAANLDRALTLEGSTAAASLEAIDDVTVEDEYTVRLDFDGPGGHIPLALSDRAGMMISPEAFDNEDLDQQPVGAGMYKVTEYRQDEVTVFEPYEDYWDPDAINVSRFEIHVMPDEQTRLNALRDGQIDATFLDHYQWEEAEGYGLNVEGVVTLAHYALGFNRSKEPFDDQRVRQAINHAVDRDALIEGVLFGHGEPAVQPFPEGHWAHNPDVADRYPHDPEKAQELLAEAGYDEGELSFELINPGLDLHTRTAEAIQAQLSDVGIDAQIRTVETVQTPDIFYGQEDGDAVVGPSSGPADPSLLIQQNFTPGFFNPGDHVVDEVADLHVDAMTPSTVEERSDAFQPLIETITEHALGVYLFHDIQPNVWTDEVVGFELAQGPRQPEFRGVGIVSDE